MVHSQGLTPNVTGWSEREWIAREAFLRRAALAATDAEGGPRPILVRGCRVAMRTYTTGFFIVSRFLPPAKRDVVEAIYAAVRYPDEVVDTFPLPVAEREARLDAWAAAYERALAAPDLRAMLANGTPAFLAGFVETVRRFRIPPRHYRDFLAAMRRDLRPRPFETMDDLIANYVHGSAIVVGWFLTYAYGASADAEFPRALESARDLGIALQLTNFLRDVADDHRRGRLYVPLDLLRAEGIERPAPLDPAQREGFGRAIRRMAEIARDGYARAAANLDAYAPECRIAIRACIDVYGLLNDRILRSPRGIEHRESVSGREKWRVLPPSRYWRIPAAYLRARRDRRWLEGAGRGDSTEPRVVNEPGAPDEDRQ